MTKKKSSATAPDFETSLAELEAIVEKLEGGKLGLEESLSFYEQGVTRLKHCYELLSSAERRVELVRGVDSTGTAHTQPFAEEAEGSLVSKGDARSRRRSAPAKGTSRSEVDDSSSLF